MLEADRSATYTGTVCLAWMELLQIPLYGLWKAASCKLQHVLLHLCTLSYSGAIPGDTSVGLCVYPCTLVLLEIGQKVELKKPAARRWGAAKAGLGRYNL